MRFIISELSTDQSFGGKVIGNLKRIFENIEGFCFFMHPFIESENGITNPSFLILSPKFGILILEAFSLTIDKMKNEWLIDVLKEGEDKKYKVYSKILEERELRDYSKEDKRFQEKQVLYLPYLPYINLNEWMDKFDKEKSEKTILFKDTISDFFKEYFSSFENEIPKPIWNKLVNTITGISKVLTKRTRRVDNDSIKAWIISKVEEQVQALDVDSEQIKIGQQIPIGPQRIRGLAGTGKTIILTMKAAFMHYKHPEWNIIYTFNTQSLYHYIQKLIERFYKYFSGG